MSQLDDTVSLETQKTCLDHQSESIQEIKVQDNVSNDDIILEELDKLTSAEIEELLREFKDISKIPSDIDYQFKKPEVKKFEFKEVIPNLTDIPKDETLVDEGDASLSNSSFFNVTNNITAVEDEEIKEQSQTHDILEIEELDQSDVVIIIKEQDSKEKIDDIFETLGEKQKPNFEAKESQVKQLNLELEYQQSKENNIREDVLSSVENSSEKQGEMANESNIEVDSKSIVLDETSDSGLEGMVERMFEGKKPLSSLGINNQSSFMNSNPLGFWSNNISLGAVSIVDPGFEKGSSIDTSENEDFFVSTSMKVPQSFKPALLDSGFLADLQVQSELVTAVEISQPSSVPENILQPNEQTLVEAKEAATAIEKIEPKLESKLETHQEEMGLQDEESSKQNRKYESDLTERVLNKACPETGYELVTDDHDISENLSLANDSHVLFVTGDESIEFGDESIYSLEEGTPDQIIHGISTHENFLNPVHEDLKLDPIVKELILDPVLRRSTNTTIEFSDPETTYLGLMHDDSLVIKQSCEWVGIDQKNFFSIKNLELPKLLSLRVIESTDMDNDSKFLFNDTDTIYIGDSISEPVKVLKFYFNKENFDNKIKIQKKKLILDFRLCDFLAFKCFMDTFSYLSKVKKSDFFMTILQNIEVRFETIDETYTQYIFDKLKSLGTLYNSIKSLGFFEISPVNYTESFSCQTYSESNKPNLGGLPSSLETFIVSNGLDMDDAFFLNGSLKFGSFYNCKKINLSKFNLTKKLEKLHIHSYLDEKVEIVKNNRTEQFPSGLLELKELKLSSQVFMNPKLERNMNLQSLTLSDLNVTMTRRLKLPPNLKVLAFENCSISSHLAAFPSSLRKIAIKGGKWREQHILTFSKLKELRIDNAEVPDIFKKVNYSKELTSLIINNCKLKSLNGFMFQKTLRHLDLSFNEIVLFDNKSSEEVNNELPFDKLDSLRELNLSNNKLEGQVNLCCTRIDTLDLSNNRGVRGVKVPKTMKSLNLSSTAIQDIREVDLLDSLVESIALNNCMIRQIDYSVPSNMVELSLSECHLNSIKLDFAPRSKLKKLDVSHNQIESIQDVNFENSVLESINFLNNHVRSFDASLPLATKILNLSYNLLDEYGATGGSIISLNLLNNQINELNNMKFNDELEVLNLNHNCIMKISEDFRIPMKLKELHLELCNINLFEMEVRHCLDVINLRNNKLHSKSFKFAPISEVENLDGKLLLSKITKLDLTGNFFKDFNFESLSNTSIDYLKLSNNMFDDIPDNITKSVLCAVFNESSGCLVNNY